MIGVSAPEAEFPVIREFFQLFKTPWEFCRPGVSYDVLICSNGQKTDNAAKLAIDYGPGEGALDRQTGIRENGRSYGTVLSWRKHHIPIYGQSATLTGPGKEILRTDDDKVAAIECNLAGNAVVRVGFDLFAEVKQLLETGQPVRHAETPALELHIAILRHWIVSHGLPLCEIPPVPAGHEFIVCLTHDVDHPRIRNHRFDHTMWGFLYRSTLGSIRDFGAGRRSFKQLLVNWRAAISLPFVHLGLAEDFWKTFEGYGKVEAGLAATFFVIPKRNEPGQSSNGVAPYKRGARYDAAELASDIKSLVAAGNEVGLHGIDAWRDRASGIAEADALKAVTGQTELGVRMHWLYFDDQSPQRLDDAGFSYDSTMGYNDTVGFRAGTLQGFQPPGTNRMLELPMHIMDTALFSPGHLNLSTKEADAVLDRIIEKAVQFGGALVINWHDRSIAPERLWNESYARLLERLRSEGAWFATCAEAAAWFRNRRSAVLDQSDAEGVRVTLRQTDDQLPGLRLRFYNSRPIAPGLLFGSSPDAPSCDLVLGAEPQTEVSWSTAGDLASIA